MAHDGQLKQSVLDELKWESGIDAAHIGVTARDGVHRSWFYNSVTVSVSAVDGKMRLTGAVESWHDREIAESIAWAAPGATALENNIVIN